MDCKRLIASLSLAAGLCAAGLALADTPVYKWVDDQGRVHYSTEPHGDKPQQLAIQNQAHDAAPPATTAPAAVSASQQAQADAQLVQAQPTDTSDCKAARDQLAQYLQAGLLYKKDDKGKPVPLSAEEKQTVLTAARINVTQNCSGGGT